MASNKPFGPYEKAGQTSPCVREVRIENRVLLLKLLVFLTLRKTYSVSGGL